MNPIPSHFALQDGQLHAESVPLAEVARQFGTPCYVYSRAALEASLDEYLNELRGVDSLVCYAVKANSNLAVLDVFARRGAGFDIVSTGELKRALAAGADPQKIVFSGVGKSAEEMAFALQTGILCFNVESAPELERLNEVAGSLGLKAPISLRVNPNVDPKTHPYISTGLKENKFGVAYEDALSIYRHAAALPHIKVTGIDCHIGSQLLDPSPFAEALDKILVLVDQLAASGIALQHIDLGGGLGIRYQDETAPTVKSYLQPLLQKLKGRSLKILLEPGRRLVGNAGVLLTTVEFLKPGEVKNFAIVDAAMNDLARPALYDAWHDFVAVKPSGETMTASIVGPVCETGDTFARDRLIDKVEPGDLAVFCSAGAYGATMASTYNSRSLVPEVLVDGDRYAVVADRITAGTIMAAERVPDWID